MSFGLLTHRTVKRKNTIDVIAEIQLTHFFFFFWPTWYIHAASLSTVPYLLHLSRKRERPREPRREEYSCWRWPPCDVRVLAPAPASSAVMAACSSLLVARNILPVIARNHRYFFSSLVRLLFPKSIRSSKSEIQDTSFSESPEE